MVTKELAPQVDVIVAAKKQYVLERKSQTPIEAVRALASMQKRPLPILNTVPESDLAPILLIGQINRSAEISDSSQTADLSKAVRRLIQAGADAVTLFTDDSLYQGGLDDLVVVAHEAHEPVISQDYVVDEYQVIEARAAGASALWLRSAILDREQLRALVSATQRNRMTAIVEVYNQADLEYALGLSPYVIALNRYDPRTQTPGPDSLETLRALIPSSTRVMLSASLTSIEAIREAVQLKVHAVMIAEPLLGEPEIKALLRRRNPDL
jgi:indole-3-glycerol phosphate synthase